MINHRQCVTDGRRVASVCAPCDGVRSGSWRKTKQKNKVMTKFVAMSVALAAAATLAVYRQTVGDADVEPETMADDACWGPAAAARRPAAEDVRPFRINVSAQVIEDLRDRLSRARPPVKPLENVNFEYGFNGDYLAKVVEHWANRYDWTARQARLNALPQFKTTVSGLDVHFVHAKPPPSPRAGGGARRTVPLLLLHGWPGSVVEFYKMVPMLTSPRDDGAGFAFEVVAPSLPGYGFSDASARTGMGPAHIGQVFVKLMRRLGHDRFYVQGGDWGAVIAEAMAKLFPDSVYGMHSNMCSMTTFLTLCDYVKLALGSYWPSLIVSSEQEKSVTYPLSKLFSTFLEETGYMHLQMTKPDTVGVALNDSPVGLAAYILEKFSTWTNFDHKNLPDGGLSKYDIDELLDNVMIYWVTGSITTSMRLYSESASKKYSALPHLKAKVKVPAACAMFPHEFPMAMSLKKLMKRKYTNLIRATEMKDGGHFAAFEQPELLAEDIWSAIIEMETIRNQKN